MKSEKIFAIIQRFEIVSRSLAHKWGKPEAWEEIYSDMCCAFIQKNHKFTDKPLNYVIKACKNEAINNYLCGKSIDSKPRNGLKIVSIETLSERISSNGRFERQLYLKILVEKIFAVLTEREIQVARLIMKGHTEREIAKILRVSQQRINRIKKKIVQKARRMLQKRVVI